jgi:hypothetical protein
MKSLFYKFVVLSLFLVFGFLMLRIVLPKVDQFPVPRRSPTPNPSVSVVEGKDGPLIENAQEVLGLKNNPERSQQWQEILTRADYFTLVRMTEIPAQPKLTEDRKELRLAAIRQLGKVGKLGSASSMAGAGG